MHGRLASMAGVRKTEIQSHEIPEPTPGQVVLDITRANICGTDVHMWEGKHLFKNHVMGHEMVGTVRALGEGVQSDFGGRPVGVGDRVVPVYYRTCMRCARCRDGLFNICDRGSDFQGAPAKDYPHFTGGFATQYVIQPGQYFYRVPDNVSDEVAAGANCGFTQMFYALDQVGSIANRRVVVQGAGGLGIYACAIASAGGAQVVAIDSVPSRLEAIRGFGALGTVDMSVHTDVETRKARATRILGSEPDLVIDLTGVPSALAESIEHCRPGGTVLELGNVSVDPSMTTTLVPGLITRKCLTVKGLLRYQPWYLSEALQFLSRTRERFPFDGMTDREYSLDETQLALERTAARQVTRAAIVPSALQVPSDE